jgi:phage terminase large subunit-like protein
MDLFAEGTKNNPNSKAQKEQEEFRQWQIEENKRLEKEAAEFIAKRIDLMESMSPEEWEDYLQTEAIENAQKRAFSTKEYETR